MALVARNINTGAVVADRVGVADTRATRAVGLLSRDGLEPGEGLWIVPSRGVHTCWMRFAIDVIALDERGVIIDRVVHLKPWRIRLPRRGTSPARAWVTGSNLHQRKPGACNDASCRSRITRRHGGPLAARAADVD
jgi:uncharacterized membrane protein (UPF0127 family)